jgi:hypothetical protein
VATEPGPDQTLEEFGRALADRVSAAVPGWVIGCVDARLPLSFPEREQVMARAEEAAQRAQREVARALHELLSADVDSQRSTPLAVVRAAVSYPTGVLSEARVPPVARDRFVSERFPDDPYGLTPASLQALDPALAEPAIAWGAAKAMAHRRRHGQPPSEFM